MTRLRTRHSATVATASIVLAIALGGCRGGGLTAPLPAQPAARNRTIANSCELSVFIVPQSAVITVNKVKLLSAYYHFPFQRLCYTAPIKARWSSTGGNLEVIGSGEEADFSASQTGSYTVTASAVVDRHLLQGTAAITVAKMTGQTPFIERRSSRFVLIVARELSHVGY